MPYIPPNRREAISGWDRPRTAGELNYVITTAIINYLDLKHRNFNYQLGNDVIGALSGADHEFKRRILDPYEDQAIERNGDVWPEVFIRSLNGEVTSDEDSPRLPRASAQAGPQRA